MSREQKLLNIIETYEQRLATFKRESSAKLYSERIIELAYRKLEEELK